MPNSMMNPPKQMVKVTGDHVRYFSDRIEADFDYQTSEVKRDATDGSLEVTAKTTKLTVKTLTQVPKVGVMLVGWGGNNGSTVTAICLANSIKGFSWRTKEGEMRPNYFGSITQASTVYLGTSRNEEDGKVSDVYAPMSDLVPMLSPNEIAFDGWDISAANLAQAAERARVLDYDLQRQLAPSLEKFQPRPSIYDPDFIAANQAERADNVINAKTKSEKIDQIRADIKDFKSKSGVETVIVLWTANTERFCDVREGLNMTAEELLESIKRDEKEISPSTLFAVASILEGCPYINGSPQNTFVPGCVDLAERNGVFIGGDDFKSGQTKFKSVIVDFLVNAGIKPTSIVSYNHLGNNDGKNLSAPAQFKSKEISKSSVVDDMVAANPIIYGQDEKPDHCIVIKYVPNVGDSKRAMDEYVSEICMGGKSTIAVHNTCEDSLLAAPIILDLVILTELCQRISFRRENSEEFESFDSVLSILSYLCKAPLVPRNAQVINSLNRQRACIENVLRACIGLPPVNNMGLEQKIRGGLFGKKISEGNKISNGSVTNGYH